ncbi:hypothetical protein [Streptomyces sp. AS58]|uniref:hypothetical protein n=1 Tax=Streptomyces sp. AS58 TaxID=1519489 RepID=UPI000A3E18E5|nr:hypothetical protein [Streptomyces sp. AS58]
MPVVARHFTGAVFSAHGRAGSDYLGRARLFAAHASLLHTPEHVLAQFGRRSEPSARTGLEEDHEGRRAP